MIGVNIYFDILKVVLEVFVVVKYYVDSFY